LALLQKSMDQPELHGVQQASDLAIDEQQWEVLFAALRNMIAGIGQMKREHISSCGGFRGLLPSEELTKFLK